MRDLERLYVACGFIVKPSAAARLCDSKGLESSVLPELTPHDAIAFERKMWRAKRIARILAHLPFVRAIAVCNSLGFNMVHEESDIDLFIISAPGRVWSARWWVTGCLALLRQRPGEARRDPICASFFIDESIETIDHLMIDRDIYFFYWLRSLMPLVGGHVLFENSAETAPEFRVSKNKKFQTIFEWCIKFIPESFLRAQQKRIMPAELMSVANKNTAVVLSDTVIKLHSADRREIIRDFVFPS